VPATRNLARIIDCQAVFRRSWLESWPRLTFDGGKSIIAIDSLSDAILQSAHTIWNGSRTLTEIRENRVKQKLGRGEVAVVLSGNTTPDMVEFMGTLDFDGVWVEGEHGPIDFADIPDITRACDLWGLTSVVRVNANEPGTIYRTLDVGAQGIVVPHVNTADEARAVVDASKFAPIGHRGMFTSRQGTGVADYVHKANDHTLVVILIEDIIAANNLSEILEVDNIDVFFVAPGDLAQSMGFLGQVTHPEVQSVIDNAFAQIKAAGRTSGALANDANIESYIGQGVTFFMTGWAPWAAAGARSFLDKVAGASS